MKKAFAAVFCVCFCCALGFFFTQWSSAHELVDASGCMECHTIVEMHDNTIHPDCEDCHENSLGGGSVASVNCLSCHPGGVPDTNAEQCDLIEFHEDNPDYMPSGDSCLSADCHINDCNGTTTITTTTPITTTEPSGLCPSQEIYGEDSEEVQILRYFRDNVLSQTKEGQEVIKMYYQWSPVITMAIRKDKALKAELKELIDEVLLLTVQ